MRTYLVEVKTTNSSKNTTRANWNSSDGNSEYYDCENGIIYVVTDDPKKIYDMLSKDTIIKIEDIGVGYSL